MVSMQMVVAGGYGRWSQQSSVEGLSFWAPEVS